MLRVVGTRKLGVIEERFHGRAARIFAVGAPEKGEPPVCTNALSNIICESVPAHEADDLRTIIRPAQFPPEHAAACWKRVLELILEFMQQPRQGDTVHGFGAGPCLTRRVGSLASHERPEPGRNDYLVRRSPPRCGAWLKVSLLQAREREGGR